MPINETAGKAGQPKGGRGGRASRQKGDRAERHIVDSHTALGVRAERVPLSGATRYQGNSTDVDVYPFGQDAAPLVCEVKARRNGEGFATLERWLSDADGLFLKRDRQTPIVVLPWRTWALVMARLGNRPPAQEAAE